LQQHPDVDSPKVTEPPKKNTFTFIPGVARAFFRPQIASLLDQFLVFSFDFITFSIVSGQNGSRMHE
jgi:hypothetical protein